MFVIAIGLLLTATLSLAARSVHEDNEVRLLRQRAREAAGLLTTAIPSIQTPLASAAVLAEASSGSDIASFQRLMEPFVKTGRPFITASIWKVSGSTFQEVMTIGAEPKLASVDQGARDRFLRSSTGDDRLHVLPLLRGASPRLGYSFTEPPGSDPHFVAYAEAALPPHRRAVVPSGSAFSGLANAVYIGRSQHEDNLLTASTKRLPLHGQTAVEHVPFGNTSLLLVMSPDSDLGGRLLALLPWILAFVGIAAIAGVALLVEWALRRRDNAQALAAQNADLFSEQRSVAQTLQHSLLPEELPEVPNLNLAVRYVPGTSGIEVGGDWYDVITLDPEQLLVVVGDVSGRGLDAARVMASLRFAIRAFASQGDSPSTILTRLSALPDVATSGHFATVLCGLVETSTRRITIANAGHPAPLLIQDSGSTYVETHIGVPVGVVKEPAYEESTLVTTVGATVLLYTDGLFERRGETGEEGLQRLRRSVEMSADGLEEMLTSTLEAQATEDASDDTALLGLRWTR